LTLPEIRQAAERIRGIVHRTPVMTSRMFNQAAGCEVFFKCENLQRGGSFKLRGGANFLYSIAQESVGPGVVAYSSGNHAQAVAIAAAARGTAATIVMPDDAPKSKVEATRGYGAKVVLYDRMRQSREEIGQRIADETGATLVPPFDHPWIVTGQGTLALELIEQVPDLDALVIQIGGGGMISGCSIAAKALRPDLRIFGVEPADANDTFLSMQAGKRVEIPMPRTIADGLRSPMPGAITFPIVQRHVEKVVLVSDEEIMAAVRFLLVHLKIVSEPSGAVPAAALLQRRLVPGLKRIGAVISGGNIDLELLASLAN
jgi:threonine dehydratase